MTRLEKLNIIGHFNSHVPVAEGKVSKINKDTLEQIKQFNQIEIYKAFNSTGAEFLLSK